MSPQSTLYYGFICKFIEGTWQSTEICNMERKSRKVNEYFKSHSIMTSDCGHFINFLVVHCVKSSQPPLKLHSLIKLRNFSADFTLNLLNFQFPLNNVKSDVQISSKLCMFILKALTMHVTSHFVDFLI